MSLQRARIFITRTPKAAAELIEELWGIFLGSVEGFSFEPEIFCVPLHQAQKVRGEAADLALQQLHALVRAEIDWVTFTSRNGVRAFAGLCEELGDKGANPAEVLSQSSVAAVGSGTAEELEKLGVSVDFIPSVQDARHMVSQWPEVTSELKVLCVQGENARPILSRGLEELGLEVHIATVYTMVDYPAQVPLAEEEIAQYGLRPLNALEAFVASEEPAELNLLVATAPSLLRAFHQQWLSFWAELNPQKDAPTFPLVIAIGNSTAEQAKELGLEYRVSTSPSAEDLAHEISEQLRLQTS